MNHCQQQQDADTQSWSDKDKGQEVEQGSEFYLKGLERGLTGAWFRIPTVPKGSSTEAGGRILQKY